MISRDQPTCFPDDVLVRVSSCDDGTMLIRSEGVHADEFVRQRELFCESIGASYSDTVYQRIVYDDAGTYKLLALTDARSTTRFTPEVVADGLFTEQPGVGMMLPIADCVGTVVYDPVKNYLSLLHLGRHSTFAGLMKVTLEYYRMRGSTMSDVIIWMSPSAQKQSYKLAYFDKSNEDDWQGFYEHRDGAYYIDMQGYNKQVALEMGVVDNRINVSDIDTATSKDYFSHSMGDIGGRFVVFAMMR